MILVDRHVTDLKACHLLTQQLHGLGHRDTAQSDHQAVDVPAGQPVPMNPTSRYVVDDVVQPVPVDVVVVFLRSQAQGYLLSQRQESPDHHQQELAVEDFGNRSTEPLF